MLTRNAQAGEFLDNAKLKEVLKAGISLSVIEDMIKASTTQFVYSSSEVVEISKAAKEGNMPQADIDKLLKIVIAEANKGQTRLREMVVRFLNMCVNGTEQEYGAMMRALLREGKAIVPYLLEKIEEENEIKRKGILDAILQIGDKTDTVTRSVKLMLDDRHMAVRAQAAKTVASLAGPATCQDLIDSLDTKKHENLDGIALALGYLNDPKAVNPLTTLLKESNDENACVAAAFALGQLRAKDERALGALLDGILSDRWDQLRYTSAQALSLIGEPRTVSYVLRAYQRYREGRARLIGTLAKFKYFEAIEFLVDCTNEDNPEVRKTAMDTLQVVTGEKYDNYDDWLSWWNINKVRPDIQHIGGVAAPPVPKTGPTTVAQPPVQQPKDEAKP
ncbi:MAG: HEAT repeat domain-containing protein [Planctomycetes bacterium]|nr:HEAT repeat domain-containing protein [Planctomycetota bacterium]